MTAAMTPKTPYSMRVVFHAHRQSSTAKGSTIASSKRWRVVSQTACRQSTRYTAAVLTFLFGLAVSASPAAHFTVTSSIDDSALKVVSSYEQLANDASVSRHAERGQRAPRR